MTRRLMVTIGLPAAGKTTYARTLQPEVVRINRDDLRRMLHGARLYTDSAEAQVTAAQHAAVRAVLVERPDAQVIVDDTNLHPGAVAEWRELAAAANAEVEIIDFRAVTLAECLRRNETRPALDQVDPAAIVGLHARFLDDQPVPAGTPWVVHPRPTTDHSGELIVSTPDPAPEPEPEPEPTESRIVREWCERHRIDFRRLVKWAVDRETGLITITLPLEGSSRETRPAMVVRAENAPR